jgi:hypothetical protein
VLGLAVPRVENGIAFDFRGAVLADAARENLVAGELALEWQNLVAAPAFDFAAASELA